MHLSEYEWGRNPRGMHVAGINEFIQPEWYSEHGFGWCKLLVAEGFNRLGTVSQLISVGVTPIVQHFVEKPCGKPADLAIYRQYIDGGARWLESPWRTPNLAYAWPDDRFPTWRGTEAVQTLMRHWLAWAEAIIAAGGYPAFPALAESIADEHATVAWVTAMLNTFKPPDLVARFQRVAHNGLWIATNPFIMNHWYQEDGVSYRAKAAADTRWNENGWHFEYPYDPICQADDPGRTVRGETESTTNGDPNGLYAVGQFILDEMRVRFDIDPVPVIGTAGGIGGEGKTDGLMTEDNPDVTFDTRYPSYNAHSHAHGTVAMFNDLVTRKEWMFGLCLSQRDTYGKYATATLALLKETRALQAKKTLRTSAVPEFAVPEAIDTGDPDLGKAVAELETLLRDHLEREIKMLGDILSALQAIRPEQQQPTTMPMARQPVAAPLPKIPLPNSTPTHDGQANNISKTANVVVAIATDNVKVRTQPGGSWLYTVEAGAEVEVLDHDEYIGQQGHWLRVRQNSREGYSAAWYFRPKA